MSARDPDDVLNVAFDQWDQYATAVAAEGVHGVKFGAFARARLSAAGFVIVPREPTEAMGSAFENALFDVVDGYDFTIDKDAAPRLWSAMLSAAEGKQ